MQRQLNVDKFISITYKEGVISDLIGLPEGGKTNIATVFMQMLVERGYNIYTNIAFFDLDEVDEAIKKKKLPYVKNYKSWYRKKPPEIHTVNSLSELFIGLLSTENNVVILDEGGIHISATRGASREVDQWKQIAYVIRHLSSAFLIIQQTKGSVVPALREDLVQIEMRVRQIRKGYHMFSIATAVSVIDDFTGEERVKFEIAKGDEYFGVPIARYPYDGKDFPYFDMDLNTREAWKRLSRNEDGSRINSLQIRKNNLGVNIIKRMIPTKEQTRTTGEIVEDKLKMYPEEPASAIASLCSCSERYVQQIRRKLRKNEERTKTNH